MHEMDNRLKIRLNDSLVIPLPHCSHSVESARDESEARRRWENEDKTVVPV